MRKEPFTQNRFHEAKSGNEYCSVEVTEAISESVFKDKNDS